jgi:hypothetical protein
MRRRLYSSCRRASSHRSIVVSVVVNVVVVSLDVDVVGGFNALSKPFVPPPCLLPPLRRCCHCCCPCHRHRRRHPLFCCRCRHCRHRFCSCCRCRCRLSRRCHRHSSSSLLLSRHHCCRRCCRHRVWLIVIFAVDLHLSPPSPLPFPFATTRCRYLVVLCCIAAADTSLIALPPLLPCLSHASWLLNCRHVGNQRHDMTYDVKKNHQKLQCPRHVGHVRLIRCDDTTTCWFQRVVVFDRRAAAPPPAAPLSSTLSSTLHQHCRRF